jgi:hypothetical protein
MTEITMDVVIQQLLAVLHEGFEGPPGPWSYFTDNRPEAGLFGTLATLSAADASRPVGGSSIAAHVNHVVFGLEASAAWIRGDRTPRDWAESWRVSTVDGAAWAALIEELRVGYADLRQAIEANAAGTLEAMGGAIGALAHVAYHLAAIRQKVACSQQ